MRSPFILFSYTILTYKSITYPLKINTSLRKMSLSAILSQYFSHFPKNSLTPYMIPIPYMIQSKSYAAKAPAKKTKKPVSVVVERKLLPVETDPHKLVNYVCGTNICKEGEDVKIKPDSEYPDWLWTIRTGPAPTLEELDPNTKQYWRKLRKLGLIRNNKQQANRKF